MSQARNALAREWKDSGLQCGDTVLIHSSIARTLRKIAAYGEKPDPSTIVLSLLDAIGEAGTLVVPLFNFDFTKGVAFDIRSSPSSMGALTETVRHWPGAVRTGHPIYSFAAIGASSHLFESVVNFSGYGADSPFAILHKINAKIGVIDLPDQHSMTFYHYVEEAHEVPYRYHKVFTGLYVGADGVSESRSFGLFVRNIENGVITSVDPMGEILWRKGLYVGSRPRVGSGLRLVNACDLYDAVSEVIDQGAAKGVLYELQL